MSEIFKSSEFQEKAAISIQIVVLDYNLSRFGPFILSIVSAMCVLKSRNLTAESDILLQIMLHTFKNEQFIDHLSQALSAATKLFGLPDFDIVKSSTKTNDYFINNFDDKEEDDDEDGEAILLMKSNSNLADDASNTTLCRSVTSSPILPMSQIVKCSRKVNCAESENSSHKKRKNMFRIKRKVICKRSLN